MTQTMRQLSDVLPLTRVVTAIQEPWLRTGSNVSELVVLSALFAVAVAVSAWKNAEGGAGLAMLRRRPA
jgi:phosphotransferase system  glucose/maltose/N-acetylglucosamine-specific IIC component